MLTYMSSKICFKSTREPVYYILMVVCCYVWYIGQLMAQLPTMPITLLHGVYVSGAILSDTMLMMLVGWSLGSRGQHNTLA